MMKPKKKKKKKKKMMMMEVETRKKRKDSRRVPGPAASPMLFPESSPFPSHAKTKSLCLSLSLWPSVRWYFLEANLVSRFIHNV